MKKIIQGNHSIHHCLDLFEILMQSDHAMTITDIADHLGVSVSPAHHILRPLLDRGYVTHVGPRKGYIIGPKFMNLSSNINAELHLANMVKPLLEELNEECENETCYLGFLHHYYVENLHTVLSDKLLSLGKTSKKSYHLHAMAQGKILLAYLPDKDYEKWKSELKALKPLTPLTIQRFEQLEKELAAVREHGYAENVQESEEGVYVAACPIFNIHAKVIAVIAVGLPIQRLTEKKRESFLRFLHNKAACVSLKLGYEEK